MEKKKIFIVDDSETDRMILNEILKNDFETLELENGYQVLETMVTNKQLPDCLLLDINMPVIDGFQVLKLLEVNNIKLPVFLTTGEATKDNVAKAAEFKLNGFMAKPYQKDAILNRMRSFFNMDVSDDLKKTEVKTSRKLTEEAILATNELIHRMNAYYGLVLRELGISDAKYRRVSQLVGILLRRHAELTRDPVFDEEHIIVTSQAAYFYDIGMTSFPGDLSRAGNEEVKGNTLHTLAGAQMVCFNTSPMCRFFVDMCSDICMHHHERADGSGYPHGRKASEVRIPAQLTGFLIEFDRIFHARKEYTDLDFTFAVNELLKDRAAYSEYVIKLLNDCEQAVTRYYISSSL